MIKFVRSILNVKHAMLHSPILNCDDDDDDDHDDWQVDD